MVISTEAEKTVHKFNIYEFKNIYSNLEIVTSLVDKEYLQTPPPQNKFVII